MLGHDHPDVASMLGNLGRVLKDLGDLPGAKKTYERALRMNKAVFGPDHPKVAMRFEQFWNVASGLWGPSRSQEKAPACPQDSRGRCSDLIIPRWQSD